MIPSRKENLLGHRRFSRTWAHTSWQKNRLQGDLWPIWLPYIDILHVSRKYPSHVRSGCCSPEAESRLARWYTTFTS